MSTGSGPAGANAALYSIGAGNGGQQPQKLTNSAAIMLNRRQNGQAAQKYPLSNPF